MLQATSTEPVLDPGSTGTTVAVPHKEPISTGASEVRLRPVFRKRDVIALSVSNVVGVGIFITPAMIAGLVGNPLALLGLWVVGGAIALAGASSYARLANLWPSVGGEYVYLSKAYGGLAGFLSGWTSLIAGFSGSVAASSVAVVLFAGQYFPGLASDKALASLNVFGLGITLSARTLSAAALIALFAALHICSLQAGKFGQNALAVLLVAIVFAFLAAGFASGRGSWSHFQSSGAAPVAPMNWLLALIPVMFTYSGWNAAVYVSEEIHSRRRSMRPALLGGTAIVILIYVLLNALYVYAVPMEAMRGSANVAASAAQILFASKWNLVTPALIVALLGNISAMTIAGPRVSFAMARDGAFIPAFARTSRRFGTPAFAIALQSLWSIGLVLLGRFDQILLYTGFAIVLSSGAAVAALFFIHHHRPATARRAPTLIVPGLFVTACAAMLIDTILDAPGVAALGVLLIAAGIPVYGLCSRHKTARCALYPQAIAGDQVCE